MNKGDVLPNFLVIGAQRCATSWMYFCLKEHPDIYLPFIKELHFFSTLYEEGMEWYKRYFSLWNGQKAIGEISPGYLYSKESPMHITKDLKDIRLIVCFRNPIDRAYSQYKKHVRSGMFSGSFEEAIEADLPYDPQYIERGFYFRYINRYFEYVPMERVLILIYEDIQKDPIAFLKTIFKFLEVDVDFVPSCCNKIVNSEDLDSSYTYVHNASQFMRRQMRLDFLIDFIKRSFAQGIFDRFFHSKASFIIRPKTNIDKFKINPMCEKTRDKLSGIFFDENKRLEDLIGRDLAFWV